MSRYKSIDIIRDEHVALAAMLRTLRLLLRHAETTGRAPDFELLRAMLVYIDEFPERLHHPKESELLFPLVRERAPEAAAVIDRLERDHARGETAIRDLEHALLVYEMLGASRRGAFLESATQYVDAYLEHMRIEEVEILPLAQRVLTREDWSRLDAAFESNRDPLTGHEPDEIYRGLFSRITHRAPAPVGLGPALE